MYSEYMGALQLPQHLRSIARAHWAAVITFCLAVALGAYAAVVVGDRLNDMVLTVGAPMRSRREMARAVIDRLRMSHRSEETERWLSMAMPNQNAVNVKLLVLPRNRTRAAVTVPASRAYESYLNALYATDKRPNLGDVFLFSGGRGLGRSYAADQLGRALSRFAPTVVISTPMSMFMRAADFGVVGSILSDLETALERDCVIVWVFEELDAYMKTAGSHRDIAQFVESTGFLTNDRRVLVFTSSKPVLFRHDYWRAREQILDANSVYAHADQVDEAARLLGLDVVELLDDDELGRLCSYVADNKFEFDPFDRQDALIFLDHYLAEHRRRIDLNDDTVRSVLFGTDDRFSVRDLIARLKKLHQ